MYFFFQKSSCLKIFGKAYIYLVFIFRIPFFKKKSLTMIRKEGEKSHSVLPKPSSDPACFLSNYEKAASTPVTNLFSSLSLSLTLLILDLQ